MWQHANYIFENYVHPKANYMVMPDSGLFFKYEGVGEYVKGWQWNYDNLNIHNTLQVLQPTCLFQWNSNIKDGFNCVFAQEIAPFVEYKLFAMQSRFDSWQLREELCNTVNDTLVNEYGDNFASVFIEKFILTKPGYHVGYLDSCMHHCLQWDTIIIDGYGQSMVYVDFYYNNLTHSNLFYQNETYPCSTCCNQ